MLDRELADMKHSNSTGLTRQEEGLSRAQVGDVTGSSMVDIRSQIDRYLHRRDHEYT